MIFQCRLGFEHHSQFSKDSERTYNHTYIIHIKDPNQSRGSQLSAGPLTSGQYHSQGRLLRHHLDLVNTTGNIALNSIDVADSDVACPYSIA